MTREITAGARPILTDALRLSAALLLCAALLSSLGMAWNTGGWPVSIAEAMIFAVTGITALRAIFAGRAHFPWTASLLFAACVWIAEQLCIGRSVYRFGTFQSLLIFLSIAGAFWNARRADSDRWHCSPCWPTWPGRWRARSPVARRILPRAPNG